jgi:hypothetical protein
MIWKLAGVAVLLAAGSAQAQEDPEAQFDNSIRQGGYAAGLALQ